jgi:hypothetical protein
MNRFLLPAALVLASTSALAHTGHGLPGEHHWHAEDVLVWGLLAVAAAGLAWWLRRK